MRKLLLQLDTSPYASVFDRIVALDTGVDEVLSYGNVTERNVRDLVHGAIFTRGVRFLHNTAIFIGGTDTAAGERLFSHVQALFFGAMRVSVMLDSNGSNTTAVAAVAKLQQVVGNVRGRRVTITAGTGPVGVRAASLFLKAGARVAITSRGSIDGVLVEAISRRFGDAARVITMSDDAYADVALHGTELLLNAGAAGVRLVPRSAWWGRKELQAAADLNAVPPLGIEGIESKDDGKMREGVVTFGALGIGELKIRIHKACIGRLFQRNDVVMDLESMAQFVEDTGLHSPSQQSRAHELGMA